MFYEIQEDKFFDILKDYSGICLDYCILKNDSPYKEIISHKDAVLFAIKKYSYDDEEGEEFLDYDISKAKCEKIGFEQFLYYKYGTDIVVFDSHKGGQIPYWYAFSNPPHGPFYSKEDFNKINSILFPNGFDHLSIYEWTCDWAEYFDEGREWWGCGLWSIYDSKCDRYIVVLASATD